MKNILLILLFCPVIAKAQFIECSVGGGPAIHTIRTDYLGPGIPRTGYNINVSATTQVMKGIRLGLSASYVYMPHNLGWKGIDENPAVFRNDPVLLEFIAVSRNKLKRFDLDLGVTGGICLNRRMTSKYVLHDHKDHTYFPKMWYTYGLTGSLQYNISRRFAVGINVHPAFLDMRLMKDFFTMPVGMKGTIKI
jgi:hypothetical protein